MTNEPPLCVDLDGTLIRTDSLAESILSLVKRSFWSLLLMPLWLLKGRAVFKANIAVRSIPDPQLLPYNEAIVAELRRQQAAGRRIALVTAADQAIAEAVARHLGLFTHVFASDGQTNLKSTKKAEKLIAEFGERQFDYIGDSTADLAVWAAARQAVLARPARSIEKSLEQRQQPLERIYKNDPQQTSLLRQLPKLLRLHQWLKNGLVFAPLVTSLNVLHFDLLGKGLLAFLIFGLCASSVYMINDLLDLPSDRRHPRKRLRPFASGNVSLWLGFVLAPALLAIGMVLATSFLPLPFTGVLVAYIIATFVYSMYLKQIVLIDVVTLAALYTMRIIAGAFAVGLMPTFWLLAFSMFIFLSLALIKRFSELQEALKAGALRIAGRGYRPTDIRLLMSLGTSSGYVAVLVLALYINSDEVKLLYERPYALWFLCPPLMYWIARMWIQAERANMHDDPLVFAARDRVTLVIALLGSLVVAAAAWPL